MITPGDMTSAKDTILIVDDTPTNIQVLAQALMKKYEVKVAINGPAALKIVMGNEKPDLILLDIMMPDMDGYEVCRRIKQDAGTRNIPIFFITARDEVSDQKKGFDLGAADYIVKPFELALVMARINVHLRLKRKTERLEKLASVDGLTDIPNRRTLESTLARECRRSMRNSKPLSVLMIDVDHFKAYNDNYGHGAGDECLCALAKVLEASLRRPTDFAGRYGGEEFAIILPDCDTDGAMKVAEKIRTRIASLAIPHAFSGTAAHVTVSIGGKSMLFNAETSGDELLQKADQALYLAKEQGRDRVIILDSADSVYSI
ncbi:diguanylate cyclase domain-containing protein [uncultured Desulfobacter sp.]|uniref:diguanylate cyclase domain-containing protein n=1 Tax=uncultured Desulfobacter sp. TaxID=240139 RepID=UPI002AAC38BF|nr:diguanylate cyclase [uncultured Desulfobacter sp.]